jgi:hypothetical protein
VHIAFAGPAVPVAEDLPLKKLTANTASVFSCWGNNTVVDSNESGGSSDGDGRSGGLGGLGGFGGLGVSSTHVLCVFVCLVCVVVLVSSAAVSDEALIDGSIVDFTHTPE